MSLDNSKLTGLAGAQVSHRGRTQQDAYDLWAEGGESSLDATLERLAVVRDAGAGI